jgi:hypothetical protein
MGGLVEMEMRGDWLWRSVREPFRARELLIVAGPEHFPKLQVGDSGVFDKERESLLDVAIVAGLEMQGADAAAGCKNGHAALTAEIELSFVGVVVLMQLADATGLDGNDGRGNGCGDLEVRGINDADFPALVALGGRHLLNAKGKSMGEGPSFPVSWRKSAAVHFGRPRIGGQHR